MPIYAYGNYFHIFKTSVEKDKNISIDSFVKKGAALAQFAIRLRSDRKEKVALSKKM